MKTVTFFDVISAMRDRRIMKFTTVTGDALSRITGVDLIASGSNYIWKIAAGLEYIWSESNLGAVVISESV